MKKPILIALALATVLSAFSCASGGTADAAGTSEASARTETSAETTTASVLGEKLDSLDLKGQKVVFRVNGSNSTTKTTNYLNDEQDGDPINDAVYLRNSEVEDKLNVKLTFDVQPYAKYNTVAATIRTLVQAGDTAYDVFYDMQYGMAYAASEGLLRNAYDSDVFSFGEPWWWEGYMNAAQVSFTERYLLAGDCFFNIFAAARCISFNKNLYTDLGSKPSQLYGEVSDGKWTLDLFADYCKKAASDLTGDGAFTEDDQLGYITAVASSDILVYGTNISLVERDKSNRPSLSLKTENMVKLTEKLVDIYKNNTGVRYFADAAAIFQKSYLAGRLLFINTSLGGLSNYRDMEDDFGIIPLPKVDDKQQSYRSNMGDTVRIGGISATTTRFDAACAALEAMSRVSYAEVKPVFTEVVLKVKAARDSESAPMIDLIHDTVAAEFAYIYSTQLGRLGVIMRDIIRGNGDFTSTYASKQSAIDQGMKTLLEQFDKIGK